MPIQTLATIGPQTQTRPLTTGWVQRTPWPWLQYILIKQLFKVEALCPSVTPPQKQEEHGIFRGTDCCSRGLS